MQDSTVKARRPRKYASLEHCKPPGLVAGRSRTWVTRRLAGCRGAGRRGGRGGRQTTSRRPDITATTPSSRYRSPSRLALPSRPPVEPTQLIPFSTIRLYVLISGHPLISGPPLLSRRRLLRCFVRSPFYDFRMLINYPPDDATCAFCVVQL